LYNAPVKATANVRLKINLSSNNSIPDSPFHPTDSSSYNYVLNTIIYDSLGINNSLQIYYVKIAENIWTTHVYVNANKIGNGELEFSPNGELCRTTGLKDLIWVTTSGASSPQKFSIDMACSTQVYWPDSIMEIWQDVFNLLRKRTTII
jgi:flagellar hook protein FlgE